MRFTFFFCFFRVFLHVYYVYNTSFQFKKFQTLFFYVCRTIRWYVTVEITFIRESIQGDEHTTAIFHTSSEIMAGVLAYDQRELLVILFNHVANFLSVGSGWRFDSVQSLAISPCLFRPTIGTGPSCKCPSPCTKRKFLTLWTSNYFLPNFCKRQINF